MHRAQIHLASIVLPLIDCIEESCGEMTVFQVERSYGLDMCTQVLDTLSLSETGVVGTTRECSMLGKLWHVVH